jgi:hypothetical protein
MVLRFGVAGVKKRINADKVVDLWDELGPAGGAATPHIPGASASDLFAALATAGTAATFDAWSMPLWCGRDAAPLIDNRNPPQ